MINGIGLSGGGLVDATRHQGGTVRTDALGRPVFTPNGSLAGTVSTAISRLAAEGPPIDSDRIASLRAAIKAGTYRPDPQAIAGKMIDGDLGASL